MTTRHMLADVSLAAGRHRDARNHYRRLLADREDTLGPGHPDTIAALRGLGSAHYARGRMADSLKLYEEAVVGYERALARSTGIPSPPARAWRPYIGASAG
jgi:tetratricopeptide (TPR) repeat protein